MRGNGTFFLRLPLAKNMHRFDRAAELLLLNQLIDKGKRSGANFRHMQLDFTALAPHKRSLKGSFR